MSPDEILTITIPIVVSVAQIAYVALGWRIYREFGWQIFKLLGADRAMKRTYAQYQIFQCFMRFDVFFWLGFSVQVRLSFYCTHIRAHLTCPPTRDSRGLRELKAHSLGLAKG